MTTPACIVRRRPDMLPTHPWLIVDRRPGREAAVCCTTWREAMDIADHRAHAPKPGGRP